ncbi:MAG: hypothetical protein AB7O24_32565 [Kofleriaceae bacterium]
MKLSILLLFLAVAGCAHATEFEGHPKVPGGPSGCQAVCQSWNMDLVGMIAMGEYSDGCICQVRGAPPNAAVNAVSAAGPAIAGVAMQVQRRQQQERQAAAAAATTTSH